jgi:hypothetical protein
LKFDIGILWGLIADLAGSNYIGLGQTISQIMGLLSTFLSGRGMLECMFFEQLCWNIWKIMNGVCGSNNTLLRLPVLPVLLSPEKSIFDHLIFA